MIATYVGEAKVVFAPGEWTALFALRDRYQVLPADDLSEAAKRYRFYRWLYVEKRLPDDDTAAAGVISRQPEATFGDRLLAQLGGLPPRSSGGGLLDQPLLLPLPA